MPNRILREGILTSERVAQLGWTDEVFYRRLMSIVDDFGRYTANPTLLRAALYPLQLEKVSDSDIGKWLLATEKAGLVRVYPASDGKRYLEVQDFRQHARAKISKYPQPPPNAPQPPRIRTADAVHAHDNSDAHAPVFVFGDEGDNPPTPHGGFARFWAEWPDHPRKVAKKQCAEKWLRKGCEAIAEVVIAAVREHRASEQWQRDDGEYIPAPLVWLNQARWEGKPRMARRSNDAGQSAEYLRAQREHAVAAQRSKPPAELLALVGKAVKVA